MILGIGTDLVKVARIRHAAERWGERFLRRVFTEAERRYAMRRRNPDERLAGRFAAKEAALKALGIGLSLGVRFREIETTRKKWERPLLRFSGRTEKIAKRLGAGKIHLSIAHDGEYAIAQVMIERR